MQEAIRVSPEEAYQKATTGSAKLVCAYEDEMKCKKVHLEDSITFKEFKSQRFSLAKDQEIIFYCA